MPPSLHIPAILKTSLPSGPRIRKIPFGAARGLAFNVDFDRHLRFYLGMYETELAPWFTRFTMRGIVSYDIGADVGYQAMVIARLTQAPVVAFEPRDDAASQVERHAELNRERIGPVRVVRAMVGPKVAPGQISLDAYESESTLDAPGLVLIDVDGGEVDVLLGAERLLHDAKPHALIETHSLSLERDCVSILKAAGYKPVIVNSRRVFGDYRPIEHNRWIAAEG